jgi:tellurite resistance protein TerC
VAVSAGYVIVSSLHIVFGELLPKSLAIRKPEGSALHTAALLRFFHRLFWLPLVVLNGATVGILRLFGMSRQVEEAEHTEQELRIILAHTEEAGVLSFERLLLLENIFDLRGVRVRDVMRPRASVKVLRAGAPWEENLKVIRETRFSRYPLVEEGRELPLGILHVKDLFYEGTDRLAAADLRAIARPYLSTAPDQPLEKLLTELRRHRGHLVLVKDGAGKWVGFLSLEDVMEEIVGSIEDEFEVEPPIFLAEALTPGRAVLGVRAANLEDAIRRAFERVPDAELPAPKAGLVAAVLDRERAMSTYLGGGLAIPHARVEGLERPVLVFARSEEGVPVRGQAGRARLLFILLSPAGSPRVQVRLLSRIAALVESEYVKERLAHAATPEEVVEAIRAGEPLAV